MSRASGSLLRLLPSRPFIGLFAGLLVSISACSSPLPATPANADHDEDAADPHRGAEIEDEQHKDRVEWWLRQRAFPGTEIPRGAPEHAREQWNALRASAAGSPFQERTLPFVAPPAPLGDWLPIGPAPLDPTLSKFVWGPLSGRLTAIAFAPAAQPPAMYAGFAQGGLWKSSDGGTSFTPLFDHQPSLAIGALAVDPANNQVIYVGTGEANESGDAYYGQGLFKSTDGGGTFTRLANGRFTGVSISKIFIDPQTAAIYLSTIPGAAGEGGFCTNFYPSHPDQGLFKSIDGGATFNVLATGATGDFEIDITANPRRVYYSIIGVGAFVLVEGGAPSQMFGLPSANSNPPVGRIELALAPSNNQVLFAGVELRGNPGYSTVYRSLNAGGQWTNLNGPDFCRDQCTYDNVVTIHPTNPNIVYLGGSLCTIWRSQAALSQTPNFQAVSLPNFNCNGGGNWASGYVHADAHAIVLDPQNTNRVWTGTDGGLALSSDGGNTWTRQNTGGFATNQFYNVCLHPTDPDVVAGGMQDNGVGARRPGGSLTWDAFQSGDGIACAYNAANPDQVLASSQFAATLHYSNNFANVNQVFGTSGNCFGLAGCGDRASFVAPMVADPVNAQTVYIGTYRLWRSQNFGFNWSSITGDLTAGGNGLACLTANAGDIINAIAVAPSQTNTIYTGSAAGVIWASIAGAAFTRVDKAPLPNRWITSLSVDPTVPKRAYVAYSGFNSATPQRPGHVFRTDDGGATWVAADIGADVPVNAILADPINSGVVYAGTDYGVLWSVNAGATWVQLGTQLPDVAVYALQMSPKFGRLVAGTHGRSAWSLAMYQPIGGACAATSQCLAGTCVDNVCCSTACTGQCASCNQQGKAGTCLPVKGVPTGARATCTGDGSLCNGICDGVDPSACAFPTNAIACRAAACNNGIATDAASCNGTGACPAPVNMPCALGCNGNICNTMPAPVDMAMSPPPADMTMPPPPADMAMSPPILDMAIPPSPPDMAVAPPIPDMTMPPPPPDLAMTPPADLAKTAIPDLAITTTPDLAMLPIDASNPAMDATLPADDAAITSDDGMVASVDAAMMPGRDAANFNDAAARRDAVVNENAGGSGANPAGCGCRVEGTSTPAPAATILVGLSLLALLHFRRRLRDRGPASSA